MPGVSFDEFKREEMNMHRIVIAALCGLGAGLLGGSAGSPAAHAEDMWGPTTPYLWDGLQPLESDWRLMRDFSLQSNAVRTELLKMTYVPPARGRGVAAIGYLEPRSPADPPQDEDLARRKKELDDRAAELRQKAERIERAQKELNEAREQFERQRRDRDGMQDTPRPADGRPMQGPPPAPRDGGDRRAPQPPPPGAAPDRPDQGQPRPPNPPPPGMEMIQHMEIVNAMAERLGNPYTAAMLGISMAKEHLKPQERYDLLTGVLKEIDGPPAVRNAAMLVLMETCHELGKDEEGRRLLSAMIVENAKKAKQKD